MTLTALQSCPPCLSGPSPLLTMMMMMSVMMRAELKMSRGENFDNCREPGLVDRARFTGSNGGLRQSQQISQSLLFKIIPAPKSANLSKSERFRTFARAFKLQMNVTLFYKCYKLNCYFGLLISCFFFFWNPSCARIAISWILGSSVRIFMPKVVPCVISGSKREGVVMVKMSISALDGDS